MDSGITQLDSILRDVNAGEPGAEERLFTAVYGELRRMAHGRMIGERRGSTLQTTVLVHEAYLRLVKDHPDEWENRRHFFGAAVRAMRQILVDRARERATAKRGDDAAMLTLDDDFGDVQQPAEMLALEDALNRLEKKRPEHAKVVQYRFFLGLTVNETAELLDVSPRTVDNRWQFAKAWLKRDLGMAAKSRSDG